MLLSDIENTEDKLSRIMVDVSNWMESKQLKLNEDKSDCIIVGKQNDLKRHDISSFRINGKAMELKEHGQGLGCDDRLQFNISKSNSSSS